MKNNVKIVGVRMRKFLARKDEFEHVKQKMKWNTKQLMKANINMHQIFNTHMLTNFFFDVE